MATVPENLLTLATHGSAEIPRFIRGNLRLDTDQLEHFSDYATWHLLDYIPENQKIRPRFGRICGDPNRAPDAHDLFRDEDFLGNFLWNEALTGDIKNVLLDLSYRPYHQGIRDMLNSQYGHEGNKLFVVDVHDYPSRYDLPMVIISNVDGQTADPSVMNNLRESFIRHLGLSDHEVQLNAHYKGGYITQHYGDNGNPYLLDAVHDRNVVQVEVNRIFYMDPRTEDLDENGLAYFTDRLTRALSEVAYAQMHTYADDASLALQ